MISRNYNGSFFPELDFLKLEIEKEKRGHLKEVDTDEQLEKTLKFQTISHLI